MALSRRDSERGLGVGEGAGQGPDVALHSLKKKRLRRTSECFQRIILFPLFVP